MEKPNLSYIKELAGDDKAFEEYFMEILKSEFPKEKLEFENSINNKDYENAHQLVHKLKHKFNILGLKQSYAVAVKFEEELINNQTDLLAEYSKILNAIESYLKNL